MTCAGCDDEAEYYCSTCGDGFCDDHNVVMSCEICSDGVCMACAEHDGTGNGPCCGECLNNQCGDCGAGGSDNFCSACDSLWCDGCTPDFDDWQGDDICKSCYNNKQSNLDDAEAIDKDHHPEGYY
jgi:hypothetical protein